MTTTLSAPSFTSSAPTATTAPSKLTATDRKLFRGTCAEVHDWMSTEDILSSIGCNFRVARHSATVGGRSYPDCQLWLRDDTNDLLGYFGNRRQAIQPGTFIEYFRAFTEASEKQISLDVVGSLDGGKTFYMASKLTNNISGLLDSNAGMAISNPRRNAYIHREDRTDHWLIVMDFYGESLAPKAVLLANELVCTNGMARKITDAEVKLSHLRTKSYSDVAPVLQRALEQSRAYDRIKDRLIHTPISMDTARQALRDFFGDPNGESKTTKRVQQIYDHSLIGSELDTRQGNLWRLASAVTQYTSHERIGDTPNAGARTLSSQLNGSRARTNNRFLEFLEEQFLDSAALCV